MSTEIGTLLVSSPDICGGRLRIEGTRITVNQIVTLSKQGYGPEEIADEYPHLTLAQVYAALAHYHANREEIEADLASEEQEVNTALESLTTYGRVEAFRELQRRLSLTPAKVTEWQDAIREARR